MRVYLTVLLLLIGVLVSYHICICDITGTITTDCCVTEVDKSYLSLALDCDLIQHRWRDGRFDFKSERLKTLAKALAPAYLRLGGTACNFLVYDEVKPDTSNPQHLYNWTRILNGYDPVKPLVDHKFVMNGDDWDNINTFAKESGFKFLFFLNLLLRKNGQWDTSNAEQILKRSIDKGFTIQLLGIGNEPNSLGHALGFPLKPKQLSDAYNTLHNLLTSGKYRRYFGKTLLVGPEVTQHRWTGPAFMKHFLPGVKTFINRVSCHQYYVSGYATDLTEFINQTIMDSLTTNLGRISRAVYSVMPASTPLWLSETSSAYGGGAVHLSDTFVAGFFWLDKLGLAAINGWKVIMRQTFFDGRYSLITTRLIPLPDYWLSLLYKRLVGTKVLTFKKLPVSSDRQRCYAHCANTESEMGYKKGAVTMFCMNLDGKDAKVSVQGLETEGTDAYMLTYHACGRLTLTSKFVNLNGKKLEMIDDKTLPRLEPLKMHAKDITLTKYSIAFFVFPDMKAKVCMT